jgi:hypothetical protein
MSVFRESLVFFDTVGLYDVVLPFLLVFTLVFGTLEKSKIFGTEKSADGKSGPYSRKNLNAMVAFCTAFFVVASAQLVSLINIFVARIALVLVIIVMFMLLVAAMHGEQKEDGFKLEGPWIKFLTFIIFIAVILIFLDGVGWLGPAWSYVTSYWDSNLMSTIFLFGIVAGFIYYVTGNPNKGEEAKKS